MNDPNDAVSLIVKTKLATSKPCAGTLQPVQFHVNVPMLEDRSVDIARGRVASSPLLVRVTFILATIPGYRCHSVSQFRLDGVDVMEAGVRIVPLLFIVA